MKKCFDKIYYIALIGSISLALSYSSSIDYPNKKSIIVKFSNLNTIDSSASVLELNSEFSALTEIMGGASLQPLFKTDLKTSDNLLKSKSFFRRIISFQEKFSRDYVQQKKQYSERSKRAIENTQVPNLASIYIMELETTRSVNEIIHRLEKLEYVEYAISPTLNSLHKTPDDPYFYSSGSWGQSYLDLYALQRSKLNLENSWEISEGQGAVVAVVDSGIDYNHLDIKDNIWKNINEIPGNSIDDDNNGYVDDYYGYDFSDNDSNPIDDDSVEAGHGSHCAGIIAAVGDNSTGIIGVAPKAKVMAVKAFPNAYDTNLVLAIKYAVDNGADIISNSWGPNSRNPSNPLIEDVVKYAYSLGCVVVFSAGNNSDNVEHYSPANMAETIAVAASNKDDHLANFSNFGEVVDVAAPGDGILSIRANNSDMYGGGHHIVDSNYYWASGTSMASPYVAGLAALILSTKPNVSVEEVRSILKYGCDALVSEPNHSFGRINAFNSLYSLDPLNPVVSVSYPIQNSEITGLVEVKGQTLVRDFANYKLTIFPTDNYAASLIINSSITPSYGERIGIIDSYALSNNTYTLLLEVFDSQNAVISQSVQFSVNNSKVASNQQTGQTFYTIQDALNAAIDGQTILVNAGNHSGSGNVNITWPNVNDISLVGVSSATSENSVVLDGQNLYSHIRVINGINFTLKNIVFKNGRADSRFSSYLGQRSGGSIYIGPVVHPLSIRDLKLKEVDPSKEKERFSKVAMSDKQNIGNSLPIFEVVAQIDSCIFENNDAYYGSVLFVDPYVSANIVVESSVVSANTSVYGAIVSGKIHISDSQFINNSADFGAVFYLSNVATECSSFQKNIANRYGGVSYLSDIKSVSSKFWGNQAQDGACFDSGGSVKLINCLVYDNFAQRSGGVFWTGEVNILNSTIVDNEPEIYFNYSQRAKNLYAYNSIFKGEFAGSLRHKERNINLYSSVLIDSVVPTNNFYVVYAISGFDTNSFVDYANKDFHLLEEPNAVVNSGMNSYWSTYGEGISFDLQGLPRISDGIIDIGAYEFNTGRLLSIDDLVLDRVLSAPNPFNPNIDTCHIGFYLNKDADVTIYIISLNGDLLFKENKSVFAGYNEILWDGRDLLGSTVASGPYYAYIVAKNTNEHQKSLVKIGVLKQ